MMKNSYRIRHSAITLLDAENRLIIIDTAIPREFFTKNYIENIFLDTSLENSDVNTIITDGIESIRISNR